MANTTSTVSGRSTIALTSATNTALLINITINTAPGLNGLFSIHDCASVGQASIMNVVWPIDQAGAFVTSPTAVGLTPTTQSNVLSQTTALDDDIGIMTQQALIFTKGITFMTQSDSGLGSFTVVFS
jgi:hypothetical protein